MTELQKAVAKIAQTFGTLPTDEIVFCSQCNTPIVAQHFTADAHVESEYRDKLGRCWDCSKK